MEKEYNDYQILSPHKMEEIAKAYLKEFQLSKNNQAKRNIEVSNLFTELYSNICHLQLVVSKNFFYAKHKDINLVLNQIQKCFNILNIPLPKTENINKNQNYCSLIQSSIHTCAQILKIYYSQNSLISENQKEEIILICINLIQNLPYLLGQCKYRKPF